MKAPRYERYSYFCIFHISHRINFATVVFDSKIYVLGGEGFKGAIIQTVEAYDPVTDRWKEIGTIPKPRRYHTTCLIDEKLWSCGGASSLLEGISTDELVFENELFLFAYFQLIRFFLVLLILVQVNGNVH